MKTLYMTAVNQKNFLYTQTNFQEKKKKSNFKLLFLLLEYYMAYFIKSGFTQQSAFYGNPLLLSTLH